MIALGISVKGDKCLNEKAEYKRGVPRAEVMNFEMKMALAEYCKDCMLYVHHVQH